MKGKSLYQDSNISTTALTLLFGLLMVGISLYLTNHYFGVKYPTGLESGSLCNFNSFFNCDKTTLSPLGNILLVPTSIFGVIIGGLVLLGLILKNEEYERTIYFTLIVNMIGCVVLFLYSLVALGGLCPMCTAYYVASGAMLFMFYKKSSDFKPNFGVLAIFLVLTLVVGYFVRANIQAKDTAKSSIATSLIDQYYKMPNLGSPNPASEFQIAKADAAPIKMAVFSDFQCPACKMLSEQTKKLAELYKGKIQIDYYFYPLDVNCNPNMERPLHDLACRAAYVAACVGPKFDTVHDEIFENQDRITSEFLNGIAKREGVEACVNDPKTKEKVVALINAAAPFNVRSTPTYLINGVKIEGVLPIDQVQIILDEILKRAGK